VYCTNNARVSTSVLLVFLKKLKDGYGNIADKLGHEKFKPYINRLCHSVEMMLEHEIVESKKIDAKYQ
jgi:hypothetical protein